MTGGVTTGGGYSDTAEIFSAQAGVWTVLEASLGTGLAKHAMATLSDGNVLIAGGQSTAGPVGSLLLFNVSDRSFTSIGNLMVARTGAVAAATPDGRVLVAGGTDINGAVLSSTEVFTYAADTMTGTVTAGPSMTYPRTNATATTTYDGVAVIGGNSGNADLGSAEIFSQWTNAFRLVGGATPRSGHIAIFLPQNGSILAMGGSGGTTVDLLQPWGNNIAGAFLTSMPSSLDHTGGFVAPATIGTMLAGGGTGSSADAAEVYWFPTISTDQPDYAPGTPVVMNGMGFKPGESVKLYMREWVNQMLVDPRLHSDNRCKRKLQIYGIRAHDFGLGSSVSPYRHRGNIGTPGASRVHGQLPENQPHHRGESGRGLSYGEQRRSRQHQRSLGLHLYLHNGWRLHKHRDQYKQQRQRLHHCDCGHRPPVLFVERLGRHRRHRNHLRYWLHRQSLHTECRN